MSKKLFGNKEIALLSKNKYVKNVTERGIVYTYEFKRLFILEDKKGKTPKQIFEDVGFDIDTLGLKRIDSSASRWKAAYKYGGVDRLEDGRKYNLGRSVNRGFAITKKYY